MFPARAAFLLVAGCATLWFCGCSDDGVSPSGNPVDRIGNLQSMAMVAPGKAYVTQLEGSGLLSVDAAAGTVTALVDLSAFVTYAGTDSAETTPFMSAIASANGMAYVACQRLKKVPSPYGTSFEPADTSLIVVVSGATDSVSAAWRLGKKNPASLAVLGSRLYVSSTGSWTDATDGGVESVDLVTGAVHLVVSEAGFDGNISELIVLDSNKGYISVGKHSADYSSFWTDLVPFNPSSGTVGTKVNGIGNAFGGLGFDGHYLYVGDRDTAAQGVKVLDPVTDAVVAGPFSVGLPPNSLAVGDTLVVVSTTGYDYSAGNMGTVSIGGYVASSDLLSIHSDNKVFVFDGAAYLLERMGRDVLTRFNGESIGAGSIVYQHKLGTM